ncbi:MAG: hypothetical protein HYS27_01055 [Deltaproteobacteria bacterium]|nr:hypothetical protein [Deltaproteobacteria bacterium]
MRVITLIVVTLLAVPAAPSCAPTTYVVAPDPPPPTPLDPFFDDLGPYGDWWWNDTWGWVWSPTVGYGWRPYTVGHWVWTAEWGWLWASSEPFGWACFHYGRWIWLDDAGWVWLPGRTWGPGWVMWRSGPGYVGWVPLGPGPFHEPHVHLWWWVVVEERHFLAPNVVEVAVPPDRNPVVLPSTRVLHRPERDDGAASPNRDIDVQAIERATSTKVLPKRVLEAKDAGAELPDAVTVRRAPDIGPDRVGGRQDLFAPTRELARDRPVDERPLSAPPDDELERYFGAARARLDERQRAEQGAPPKGVPPDKLRAMQEDERRVLEEQEQKEREAAAKKKAQKRPALVKKTKKR